MQLVQLVAATEQVKQGAVQALQPVPEENVPKLQSRQAVELHSRQLLGQALHAVPLKT